MSVKLERQRQAPPRLLAALRRAEAPEAQLRRHYGLRRDEPFPEDTGEPLSVEDME
jgi:hypothetical protein